MLQASMYDTSREVANEKVWGVEPKGRARVFCSKKRGSNSRLGIYIGINIITLFVVKTH